MKCRLCNSEEVSTIYAGPIRSGGADSAYEDGFTVKACGTCGIEFLDPFPNQLASYYATPHYWRERYGAIDAPELQGKHDPEQLRWLQEIGPGRLRGKCVADFGCGPGVFLDLVAGIASETIGVEPARHFQEHLESNGHRCLQHAEELEAASVEVAVSFDTLEHMEAPGGFLKAIHKALVPGGLLCLGVPNQRDFLKRLVPAYLPFFYHRSHLFYFNADTLVHLIEGAGFTGCEAGFVHKYDLMNLAGWAAGGKGEGGKGSSPFDRLTEDAFRAHLERQGIASHVFVRARK